MNEEPAPLHENIPHIGERDRPGRSVVPPAQPPAESPILRLHPEPPAAAGSPPQPAEIRRTRNGKIARLAKPERDMVNRMIFNNVPHERIVLALECCGVKVTRRNISNWKTRGGYREWRLAQEHALQTQLHQDNLVDLLRRERASELPEVGLQAAATQLTQFFLKPEAAQLLCSDPKEYNRRLAMLGKVAVQLKALQQYRDDCAKGLGYKQDPEHIRQKTEEQLEDLREMYSGAPSPDIRTPNAPHRNFIPKSS